MRDQWRLLCNILWPEPTNTSLPLPQARLFKNTYYLLPYNNAVVKNAVRNNKFHHHKESAQNLAHALDVFLAKYKDLTIIAIPSSNRRLRSRGFEHLLTIIELSTHKDCLQIGILRKHVHTKPQSHVDKGTRLKQQRDSFLCHAHIAKQLTGTVVLLDDVVTTGSTMAAARNSLAPHLNSDTKLVCLAIAH